MPGRALNRALTKSRGSDVLLIEALQCVPGQRFQFRFESWSDTWRQGIWLATTGQLLVNQLASAQFVLWADTSPSTVDVDIVETDGLLRFYNVWDSGRALGPHESQSATSGMVAEAIDSSSTSYRCNDIGHEPSFTKLVFTVARSANLS